MITVYTIKHCTQCDATKKWLKKHNTDFKEIDLHTADNVEELLHMGFNTAPIVIANDEKWCGFRPDLLDKIKKE